MVSASRGGGQVILLPQAFYLPLVAGEKAGDPTARGRVICYRRSGMWETLSATAAQMTSGRCVLGPELQMNLRLGMKPIKPNPITSNATAYGGGAHVAGGSAAHSGLTPEQCARARGIFHEDARLWAERCTN